jgi:hypothetical protein
MESLMITVALSWKHGGYGNHSEPECQYSVLVKVQNLHSQNNRDNALIYNESSYTQFKETLISVCC